MAQDEPWSEIAVPEIEFLPKPVFMRSQFLTARQVFPVHSHRWNQFVYAISGTLLVTVEDSLYVITPEQAMWVPTGVLHTTGALHGAEFRNLYVADLPGLAMPDRCTVFAVSPLLRALIIELAEPTIATEDEVYVDQLNGLIIEQLRRLQRQDFHLPWPRSATLRQLCETLYANPADERSVEDWGGGSGGLGPNLGSAFRKGNWHEPAGLALPTALVSGGGMALWQRTQHYGNSLGSGLCLTFRLHLYVPSGNGLQSQ